MLASGDWMTTRVQIRRGSVETPAERIEHMRRLRDLQDETGGFTAFIAWSYQPEHTELQGAEATGIEYLRTLATARLFLDNFDNLQASWVTQGPAIGQVAEPHGGQRGGHLGRDHRGRLLAHRQRKRDVLRHRHVREQ